MDNIEKIALNYVENYCEPEDNLLKELSRETALTQLQIGRAHV